RGWEARPVKVNSIPNSAALLSLLVACVFDENAPHGLGGRSKEVASAVPVLRLLHVYEPQVRLVDEGRRLQRLAWGLQSHLLGRQLAQLDIDQGHQLVGGVRVAFLDGGQDAGTFIGGTPWEDNLLNCKVFPLGKIRVQYTARLATTPAEGV